MEHLQRLFHEELDGEGDIVIAGETFKRHHVLNGLAPEAYRIAFEEWIEQRNDRLLDKANDILGRFDNADRFDQLQRAYQSGNMRPFVGAGLSIGSGYPGWTSFLWKLCKESDFPEEELNNLLQAGKYEEAAESITADLGYGLFNENVQATYARPRRPEGVINYLPRLFPNGSVLTTNFDPLLEQVYEGDDYQGFDRVVSGKALGEVARQIAAGARLLVKLHGHCDQVADRILLKSEYDAAYGDSSAVTSFFNRVIFGSSLLFLGCSLCVDRTIGAMRKIVEEYGAENLPRHYAYLELRATDHRIRRKKDLAGANIFPIWYDENDHDESLEALFLKMLEAG